MVRKKKFNSKCYVSTYSDSSGFRTQKILLKQPLFTVLIVLHHSSQLIASWFDLSYRVTACIFFTKLMYETLTKLSTILNKILHALKFVNHFVATAHQTKQLYLLKLARVSTEILQLASVSSLYADNNRYCSFLKLHNSQAMTQPAFVFRFWEAPWLLLQSTTRARNIASRVGTMEELKLDQGRRFTFTVMIITSSEKKTRSRQLLCIIKSKLWATDLLFAGDARQCHCYY